MDGGARRASARRGIVGIAAEGLVIPGEGRRHLRWTSSSSARKPSAPDPETSSSGLGPIGMRPEPVSIRTEPIGIGRRAIVSRPGDVVIEAGTRRDPVGGSSSSEMEPVVIRRRPVGIRWPDRLGYRSCPAAVPAIEISAQSSE